MIKTSTLRFLTSHNGFEFFDKKSTYRINRTEIHIIKKNFSFGLSFLKMMGLWAWNALSFVTRLPMLNLAFFATVMDEITS